MKSILSKIGRSPCSSRIPWGAPPSDTPTRTSAYDTSWNLGNLDHFTKSDVRSATFVNRAFTRHTAGEAPGPLRRAILFARDAPSLICTARKIVYHVDSSLRDHIPSVLAANTRLQTPNGRRFPLETQLCARQTRSNHLAISRHDSARRDGLRVYYVCTRIGQSQLAAHCCPQTAPPHAAQHARQWMRDMRFSVEEKNARAAPADRPVPTVWSIPDRPCARCLIDRERELTETRARVAERSRWRNIRAACTVLITTCIFYTLYLQFYTFI